MLVDDRETQWHALVRYGALNRGGAGSAQQPDADATGGRKPGFDP